MEYGIRFLKSLQTGQKITIAVTPDKAKSLRVMATQVVRIYGHRCVPGKKERFSDRQYKFQYDYDKGMLTIDVLPAHVKAVPWNGQ